MFTQVILLLSGLHALTNTFAAVENIPEAPTLPDLDYDLIPEYIQRMLANTPHMSNMQNKPSKDNQDTQTVPFENQDKSTVNDGADDYYVDNDYAYSDGTEQGDYNKDKLEDDTKESKEGDNYNKPKTYGMFLNSDHGYVWNNFIEPGLYYSVGEIAPNDTNDESSIALPTKTSTIVNENIVGITNIGTTESFKESTTTDNGEKINKFDEEITTENADIEFTTGSNNKNESSIALPSKSSTTVTENIVGITNIETTESSTESTTTDQGEKINKFDEEITTENSDIAFTTESNNKNKINIKRSAIKTPTTSIDNLGDITKSTEKNTETTESFIKSTTAKSKRERTTKSYEEITTETTDFEFTTESNYKNKSIIEGSGVRENERTTKPYEDITTKASDIESKIETNEKGNPQLDKKPDNIYLELEERVLDHFTNWTATFMDALNKRLEHIVQEEVTHKLENHSTKADAVDYNVSGSVLGNGHVTNLQFNFYPNNQTNKAIKSIVDDAIILNKNSGLKTTVDHNEEADKSQYIKTPKPTTKTGNSFTSRIGKVATVNSTQYSKDGITVMKSNITNVFIINSESSEKPTNHRFNNMSKFNKEKYKTNQVTSIERPNNDLTTVRTMEYKHVISTELPKQDFTTKATVIENSQSTTEKAYSKIESNSAVSKYIESSTTTELPKPDISTKLTVSESSNSTKSSTTAFPPIEKRTNIAGNDIGQSTTEKAFSKTESNSPASKYSDTSSKTKLPEHETTTAFSPVKNVGSNDNVQSTTEKAYSKIESNSTVSKYSESSTTTELPKPDISTKLPVSESSNSMKSSTTAFPPIEKRTNITDNDISQSTTKKAYSKTESNSPASKYSETSNTTKLPKPDISTKLIVPESSNSTKSPTTAFSPDKNVVSNENVQSTTEKAYSKIESNSTASKYSESSTTTELPKPDNLTKLTVSESINSTKSSTTAFSPIEKRTNIAGNDIGQSTTEKAYSKTESNSPASKYSETSSTTKLPEHETTTAFSPVKNVGSNDNVQSTTEKAYSKIESNSTVSKYSKSSTTTDLPKEDITPKPTLIESSSSTTSSATASSTIEKRTNITHHDIIQSTTEYTNAKIEWNPTVSKYSESSTTTEFPKDHITTNPTVSENSNTTKSSATASSTIKSRTNITDQSTRENTQSTREKAPIIEEKLNITSTTEIPKNEITTKIIVTESSNSTKL